LGRADNSSIQAVLFDATGTLIELREPVGDSYARFAARHGVSVPAWRIDDGFRRILRSASPRLFPDAAPESVPERERSWWRKVVRDSFRAADQSLHFDDFEAFFEELFDFYASAEAWRLRSGATSALRVLRDRGLRLGLVSDFDYRLTELLESLEIASFFDAAVLAGAYGVAKPDARLFRAALDSLQVPASNALYVGDDPERDLAGARAAGLRALDVKTLDSLASLPDRLATLAAPAAHSTENQ
jgi:putative hydrolase of the HAD superfamily